MGRRRQFQPSYEWWVAIHVLLATFIPSLTCSLALKNFISYRRYETMSLHGIMQGLSTTSCKWTASGNTPAHTPMSDSLKQRELLEEFVIWYFGSFVAPLLRVSLNFPPILLLPS